ncbi:MAG: DUF2264 domain-containing protein [Verrucomicrobiaceae bacterium]|nr:DUF2264 domain-containing protein [Verrucomicrobiaceae bacterium]
MNRRHFFQSAVLSASLPALSNAEAASASMEARSAWVDMLVKVSTPVIANLAAQQLKQKMPVEAQQGQEAKRAAVTHLEALGRTLAGLAPWLAASGLDAAEESRRGQMAAQARKALASAVEPTSADKLDFTAAAQNLVDASFLALGLSRAQKKLWDALDATTRERLITALQSTRQFKPGQNNWLLFSATIEAFLGSVGAAWLPEPIETAIAAHEAWYQGDGMYGDGPEFHWDYYNSFVIQPMLLAVLDLMKPVDARWEKHRATIVKRAQRFAAIQERLIAPDGSYPPIGRSITYRCGAFHHLADMALRHQLPATVAPAQVRGALSAVIQRTLTPAGTFDDQNWLRIGLAGHQPSLGEGYISTGSLYLCTFAFLPLGLPPSDAFWSGAAIDRSSVHIWSGHDLHADHAI